MIIDADKYDEIDALKYKLFRNYNKLIKDLKNLEYDRTTVDGIL